MGKRKQTKTGFDENVTKAGKVLLAILFLSGPVLEITAIVLGKPTSTGFFEPLMFTGIGAFLIIESVWENGDALRKFGPHMALVLAEFAVGGLLLAYGGALALESTSIVPLLSPFKALMLAAGFIGAVIEIATKW